MAEIGALANLAQVVGAGLPGCFRRAKSSANSLPERLRRSFCPTAHTNILPHCSCCKCDLVATHLIVAVAVAIAIAVAIALIIAIPYPLHTMNTPWQAKPGCPAHHRTLVEKTMRVIPTEWLSPPRSGEVFKGIIECECRLRGFAFAKGFDIVRK